MKTIYSESQGYLRVTDEVAEQKVKTGVFKYVPKSAMKNANKAKEEVKDAK